MINYKVRIEVPGEHALNIFTRDKIHADKFLFEALLKNTSVKVTYEKFVIEEVEDEKNS